MFQQQHHQPQQQQQQPQSRQRSCRVPLARAYDGYFVHPAYGPVHVDIQVRLETTAEGTWRALGQNQRVAVQRHADGRVVLYDKDGETQLDGVIDAQSGSIIGEVIQSGERGGRFILESTAGAALAPKPQVVGRLTSAPGLRLQSRDFGGTAPPNQAALPSLLTAGVPAGGPQTSGGMYAASGVVTKTSSNRTASYVESQSPVAAGAAHQQPAGTGAHASYTPAAVVVATQGAAPLNSKRHPRHSWPGPLPPAAVPPRSSPRVAAQAQQHVRAGQPAMMHQHVVAH